MNARTGMIGIAACAAAILAGGCAMTEGEAAKGQGTARIVKVACLGDSLTSGMNMADPEREKYPAQLGALAGDGVEVKGFAIPGRTALRDAQLSVWKEDYFQEALKWNPDVVVICLGANDCWPAIWSEHGGKFKKDLAGIVAAFARRRSRPRIWLATPMPFFIPADRFPGNVQLKILEDETVPAVKEVAAAAGVGFIDLYHPMQGRRELFFPDGVHPNPAGAARMAERVWEAIGPAVKCELIVCGWDEVFILDYAKLDADGKPAKTWSWKAAERQDLPEAFRGKFATTDECKPDANGSNILVTASSGGIAVVRRADGAVRFHAAGSNVHSADWLPNGRIAVAMSVCSRGEGDRLTLFDLGRPNAPLQHEPLPGGHGAVWDGKRHLLWALSSVDIRVFRLESWDTDAPRLVKIETIPLPEGGGHDFFPVPDSDDLTVTTSGHVWLFNRADKAFRKHPVLGDVRHVKCVNRHPVTGRTVYVKADEPNWWSASLRFLDPEGDYTVPGEHFYKARWNSR